MEVQIMMSLEIIQSLSAETGLKARRQKRVPYVFSDASAVEQLGSLRGPSIPNLGDYCPKGWELVETLFVDSSGWGDPSEPAMTQAQFRQWVADRFNEGKTYGYAVVESGQFQVYVGVFEKQ